jgi:hypothetical protein
LELLFIGEAPPASGLFFYCRNSGLYRAMRHAFQIVDPAIDDDNFLAVFKASGCYLIDLCPEPADHLDLQSRRAARRASEESLSRTIAHLRPAMIAIALRSIAENVTQAASLVDWRGPIIHLPYPGRWLRHRNAFVEALTPTISRLMRIMPKTANSARARLSQSRGRETTGPL